MAMAMNSAALAGPEPVVGGPLLDEIIATPPGQWRLVSRNAFSAAWTPAALRPLRGASNPTPSNIISAWSGFAWDSRRGDLIIYGGGHANYTGNDVYRFRSSTLAWERAALPSEIARVPGSNTAYMAIDGPDAAPASAHTYDNNLYLPVIDRFLTFGGAVYDSGSFYLRPDEAIPGATRRTGPYLFDPARSDPWRVGGTTGSHVKRVAPYANVTGGNMWENRDHFRALAGQAQPGKHVNGCTAYAEENGADVVYVAGTTTGGTTPDLYRYVFGTPGVPSSDSVTRVGIFWNGTSGRTTCGYDPARKLFVRSGSDARPLVFWDLTTPGPQNRDVRVEVNGSVASFVAWMTGRGSTMGDCALDFDPIDATFALWCGGPQVWRVRPPPTNVAAGWSIEALPLPASGPTSATGTGILGKWKYLPGFDVFAALQDSTAGNVWIYKPLGWTAPGPGDAVNFAPRVSLDAPSGGSVHAGLGPIALAASAHDSDGSVARVDFYANDVAVGSRSAAPYALSWTPPSGGSHVLQARVVDNQGGEGVSAAVAVFVVTNLPPSATLSQPNAGQRFPRGQSIELIAGASDPDGSVQRVAFYANGTWIGEDTSAPFTLHWLPPAEGNYTLMARATDNAGASGDSPGVAIVITPSTGTTLVLQQGASGYAGMTDTMLSSFHPTSTAGGRTTLLVNRNEYSNLFRFAIFASEGGPVPDGATIEGATLEIYKQAYEQVFRVHALRRPWSESQATWQSAATGAPWSVPGALGAGTDYETVHDAQLAAPWAAGWMRFDVSQRVRAYASGASNHGWRLSSVSGPASLIKIPSSEYPDNPALRPRLTVTFVP